MSTTRRLIAVRLADGVLCGAVMNTNQKQTVVGAVAFAAALFGGSKAASAQEVEAPPPMVEPPPPPPPFPPACEYGCDEAPPRGEFRADYMKKRQGVDLSFDLSEAAWLRTKAARGFGVAVDTRAGYRFAAGPLFFAPGVDIGWVDFPKWEGALRAGIGGRIGVDGGFIEPSVYAYGGGFANIWKDGSGLRAGGALDLRPTRRLVIGAHADYDTADWHTGSLSFVGIGGHVGFVL
jgi:hypothetical protein